MTAENQNRPWKTGFEIELMAPPGRSRRDLADRIAARIGGTVRTVFYPQSEPSLVPNLPVFENLVLGFDVLDPDGRRAALLVDDLTLRADLDRNTPALPGWLRVLSDDARLLDLVQRHCDPTTPRETVLAPVAALYGTELVHAEGDITKAVDGAERPVAMAAPLPGERERPCEIITPPYKTDPAPALTALLADAAELGFTVPVEAAVHIHFDAGRLTPARTLSRLILVLHRHGDFLRRLVGTNPNCVRLGSIADNLVELAKSDAFQAANPDDARAMLVTCKPTKYADFNFRNLAHLLPGKTTFEARIFPGSMDAGVIVGHAQLMESILVWAEHADAVELPETGDDLLRAIELASHAAARRPDV
ncbi:amidoligase family protein [Maricaulis sp.]|uniref:amidoligase family protein n=1 Tax=Maricaulis sp. TaxID=1486257 RepID=UPI002B273F9E|nr:amidoligase family protein [Maricaulis sp.]